MTTVAGGLGVTRDRLSHPAWGTSRGDVLLMCSAGGSAAAERRAITALVDAVRRLAPSVEVHELPAERYLPDATWPAPRVAVPLAVTDGTAVSRALRSAARRDRHLLLAAPLGPEWVLAELCVRRLIEAGATKDDTVVLGVADASDADAAAGYARAARLVGAVWGGPIAVGALTGSASPLCEALAAARFGGERVVLASYVLTPGDDAERLRHSGADLVTAPLLDGGPPDPRLVTLVLDRFHRALGPAAVV